MSEDDTPLWRWLVVGGLCAGSALYLLYSGELPIDKARRMVVGRASPVYWITVGILGAFGVLALRKAWRQIRGD